MALNRYYKNCIDAQEIVDKFTKQFRLGRLQVEVRTARSNFKKLGAIAPSEAKIILWENNIPNKRMFIKVILHECAHWWLYRYLPRRHKNENDVCQMTELFVRQYYQKALL